MSQLTNFAGVVALALVSASESLPTHSLGNLLGASENCAIYDTESKIPVIENENAPLCCASCSAQRLLRMDRITYTWEGQSNSSVNVIVPIGSKTDYGSGYTPEDGGTVTPDGPRDVGDGWYDDSLEPGAEVDMNVHVDGVAAVRGETTRVCGTCVTVEECLINSGKVNTWHRICHALW